MIEHLPPDNAWVRSRRDVVSWGDSERLLFDTANTLRALLARTWMPKGARPLPVKPLDPPPPRPRDDDVDEPAPASPLTESEAELFAIVHRG